ncbi:enoyl-CoA hydratase-related protein, partial [[Clostridium] innocuum]|nr:enoyl-CoA hydratase-related protein [[Clostridium] innocuum]
METILVNYEGHVATITINRPKALNALSTQVLTELNQALDEVAANNDVYALVLTG